MSQTFKHWIRISFKVFLLITLILAAIGYGGPWVRKAVISRGSIFANGNSSIRIAIINSFLYHGEIWYSYMYAAKIRARVHVSLFTDVLPHSINDENGLSFITRSWIPYFSYRMQEHVNQLLDSTSRICSYRIILMATLEVSQLKRLLNTLLNHCDQNATYLLLLQIHVGASDLVDVEKSLSEFPKLWLQKRIGIRLLALADHVKKYAEQNMKTPLPVDIWIPVFPLDLPADSEHDEHHRYLDFVIQGNIDSHRRNYSGFIAEIRRNAVLLDRHGIIFTIVGRSTDPEDYRRFQAPQIRLFIAPQTIPANIYYSFIHQSVGIIPIFARDVYYNGTQSSSIRTSLITRTPLLASQRLLETHPHIPRDTVWLKHDNETDIEAVLRIVTSYSSNTAFRKELFKKRQHLGRMVESYCVQNTLTIRGYAKRLTQQT